MDEGRTQFSQRYGVWFTVLITEFCDHERRAMSTDHRLDSAWFGAGAAIKQRGLEQALEWWPNHSVLVKPAPLA
jgi:hypothetical protein